MVRGRPRSISQLSAGGEGKEAMPRTSGDNYRQAHSQHGDVTFHRDTRHDIRIAGQGLACNQRWNGMLVAELLWGEITEVQS
jgi:hypothetical protein